MKFLKLSLTILLFLTSFVGDYLVFKSKYAESHVFRALMDSLVHATIGFLSSILFFTYDSVLSTNTRILNVLLCTMVSSLIDIDHVFLAKSFNLMELTSLKQRGIFHCTTLWLLVTTLLLWCCYITKNFNLYLFTYMATLAYSSHHFRDANRRGIWLFPFGSTPALDKQLYLTLICTIPHLLGYTFMYTKELFKSNTIDYKMIV